MQRIDPTIEKPTRDMLGAVIRADLDEFGRTARAIGDERFLQCVVLCIIITGYIAIDVCENQWPGNADFQEIARHATETTTKFDLNQDDVYKFLSRVVFGSEKLHQVFPDLDKAGSVPVVSTARILVSFCPREREWWEYLEQIEEANETALGTNLAVLPALMFRSRHPTALASPTAEP
jgi:hypothetical protein